MQQKKFSSRILTKQATHGPESKLLQTSNCELSKTALSKTALSLLCDDVVPFLPEVKNSQSSLH